MPTTLPEGWFQRDVTVTRTEQFHNTDRNVEAGRYRFLYFPTATGGGVLQAYRGGTSKATGARFDPEHECVDRINVTLADSEAMTPYIESYLRDGEWSESA
ncbi:hypothetical protein [Candidatus Solirubrobacter pratensis]|uniref:hypothetical protein n=1 Tax=Candidatus Solirubrobacter pratensis TaxID=1298857 RepID=UPI0003FC67E8|nr:hypothetical protein [Candidatus Solirubrobacter pratensis]